MVDYKTDILNFLYCCLEKDIKLLSLREIKTYFPKDAKYVRQVLLYLQYRQFVDRIGHSKHYKYFITVKGIAEIEKYNKRCASELTSLLSGDD